MSQIIAIALIFLLITTAALGGFVLARMQYTEKLERRALAYRGQIARLKRALDAESRNAATASGDLDRARRRLRRYEAALLARQAPEISEISVRSHDETPEDRTQFYEPRDLEPEAEVLTTASDAPSSGELDGEVLQNVEKRVDLDRLRVHFVRREIA